jgi:RimJ/RimL family protein N-acetyltransferase
VAGVPGEAFLQPVLEGPTLRLRPLDAGDFEPLYAVASDPLVWEQHPEPLRYQRDVFEGFFAGAMASHGALLVVHRDSGTAIGTSRYYDLDEANREVAIGYTFLSREFWGGATNTEMKRLMLEHAFGWATAVWFHVGPQNFRSRRAVEKLGARFDRSALRGSRETVFYRLERPAFEAWHATVVEGARGR